MGSGADDGQDERPKETPPVDAPAAGDVGSDSGIAGPPSSAPASSSGAGEGGAAEAGGSPAELPDFELLAEIGRGGFGSVWIAKHRHTGDAVAIKFIPPRSRETELKGLQMLRQRVREGQDHLVWTEYIGEAGEFIYCVMDLADNVVEGPLFPDRYEALTLFKYLKQRGRLDLSDALAVAVSMAKGLAFLQNVGLRHGDVKPANVLRVRGRWKLADYGMMGGLDARARGGTRSYVPPEGPHGERADQYALGVVLHELVFGRKPSKEASSWPSARLGTGLRRICERMLEPDASRRFASMGEIVEAFDALEPRGGATAATGSACPHCGEAVDDEQEVCGSCGGDLWQTCPACQHRGSVLQRFCTRCRAPVHAIAALEEELAETSALLAEGRHREVVGRAEGPLADLCHEVEHQLSRMQGGDLARTRRGTELRERLDGRRRRLIEQANELKAADDRIAEAHAAGHVTELRAAVETALRLLPDSPNYRRLRAELPKLEAQSRWNAVLTDLGNPQREMRRLRREQIQHAIRTIKLRMPDDPDVRIEAKRLVEELKAEQARRLRESCRRRAERQRGEGRAVEALEWLRRAETAGVADDAVLASIAELVAELEGEHLPTLLATMEDEGAKSMPHGRLRRTIREIAAIQPKEARLADWRSEWSRRRRLSVLKRIKKRCIAAIAAEDVGEWQRLLAMAYRVAGRDAGLADRVLELDNALQARWNLLQVATRAAAAADAAGEVLLAYEKWREAAEIASESPAVAARLDVARQAAEAYPRQRRRRLAVIGLFTLVLAAAAAVVGWQTWNWREIDRWVQTPEALATASAGDFETRLARLDDKTRFPLGAWGLRERVLGAWWNRLDDGIAGVVAGRGPTPEAIGTLAKAYAATAEGGVGRVESRFAGIVEDIRRESPDPGRLLRTDRLLIASGVGGSSRQELRGRASVSLQRIRDGASLANLGAWWSAAEGAPTTGDGLASEVHAAFDARCGLEVADLERVADEFDAAIVEAASDGRWAVEEIGEEARGRIAEGSAFGCEAAAGERLNSLQRRLALVEDWSDRQAEIPIGGLGPMVFHLVAIDGAGDGAGRMASTTPVDEDGWRRALGSPEQVGDAVALDADEVRRRLEGLGAIEYAGRRWRLFLPDRDEWTALDRAVRSRGEGGLRERGDSLEDLAIAEINGVDRAFRMPSGELWSARGSIAVGLRLFLRPE